MLAVATVKRTPNEFTAQASDETWFRLAIMADQQHLGGVSQRIRTELSTPLEGDKQRRITFQPHEAEVIERMIETGR